MKPGRVRFSEIVHVPVFSPVFSPVEAMSHARLAPIVTHQGRGHEVQPLFNPARTRHSTSSSTEDRDSTELVAARRGAPTPAGRGATADDHAKHQVSRGALGLPGFFAPDRPSGILSLG